MNLHFLLQWAVQMGHLGRKRETQRANQIWFPWLHLDRLCKSNIGKVTVWYKLVNSNGPLYPSLLSLTCSSIRPHPTMNFSIDYDNISSDVHSLQNSIGLANHPIWPLQGHHSEIQTIHTSWSSLYASLRLNVTYRIKYLYLIDICLVGLDSNLRLGWIVELRSGLAQLCFLITYGFEPLLSSVVVPVFVSRVSDVPVRYLNRDMQMGEREFRIPKSNGYSLLGE